VQIHVDSIGLSRDGSTLYFGAVTGSDLFSVPTEQLLAAADGNEEGAASHVRVETATKPVTDGLSVDGAGNIWLTAFALSSLAVAVPGPAGGARLVKVVQSESLLRWPDGLSFGPDGLYVTNSALHLHMQAMLAGHDLRARHGPFHILRLPTAALRTVAAALGQRADALLPAPGQ
jgi:sugar lactone lactonase YvrE